MRLFFLLLFILFSLLIFIFIFIFLGEAIKPLLETDLTTSCTSSSSYSAGEESEDTYVNNQKQRQVCTLIQYRGEAEEVLREYDRSGEDVLL